MTSGIVLKANNFDSGDNFDDFNNPVGNEHDDKTGDSRAKDVVAFLLFFCVAGIKNHAKTTDNDKDKKNDASNDKDIFNNN